MESGELGFRWITEILNSRYEEEWREQVASEIVESLGKHFFRKHLVSFITMQPAWIPSLLGILSLSEKLDKQSRQTLVALRIMATSKASADFGTMILPILVSSLLPTHPLQSRRLAPQVFYRFMFGWFTSQMENVPSEDLNKLVRAVGDPFHSPDFPLQDGEPMHLPYCDPIMVTTVLIGFASSDLWRNHLRCSNFTSFEEIVSTWDGKRTALRCMADHPLPECLFSATGIVMAIRHLEEIQCPNTTEVVIMWAWTIGVVNPVDCDGWQLIGRDTLRFCQTRGMERLIALKRHITDRTMESSYIALLLVKHHGKSQMKDFFELPVLKLEPNVTSGYHTCLYLAQACQLRRLYQLVGYDPTMWEDVVAVEEVDGKTDASLGHSLALSPFMDWACDYP